MKVEVPQMEGSSLLLYSSLPTNQHAELDKAQDLLVCVSHPQVLEYIQILRMREGSTTRSA